MINSVNPVKLNFGNVSLEPMEGLSARHGQMGVYAQAHQEKPLASIDLEQPEETPSFWEGVKHGLKGTVMPGLFLALAGGGLYFSRGALAKSLEKRCGVTLSESSKISDAKTIMDKGLYALAKAGDTIENSVSKVKGWFSKEQKLAEKA